jgi:hypothetical protein
MSFNPSRLHCLQEGPVYLPIVPPSFTHVLLSG